MAKITDIIIAGKRYPMRYSIAAGKAITKKFGGLKDMGEAMFSGKEDEALDTVTWVTELLIQQGCAYKNMYEADQPFPDDAPIVDGKYVPISKEELEIALDIGEDMQMLTEKLTEAIYKPDERKVEAEEVKTKNPKAT